MSDTSTSLRDPIFYRWHRFMDNIFQQYKATLKPYTREEVYIYISENHIPLKKLIVKYMQCIQLCFYVTYGPKYIASLLIMNLHAMPL